MTGSNVTSARSAPTRRELRRNVRRNTSPWTAGNRILSTSASGYAACARSTIASTGSRGPREADTLNFGAHIPADRLAAFVAHHRAIHQARLTHYELDAQSQIDDPYRKATLDFGLAYERAVIGWFDQLEI